MINNCSNQIVSEDYFDFIVDYTLNTEKVLAESAICIQPIEAIFTSIYMPLRLLPANQLSTYGYKVFPRLFGMMDVASLEESGVARLRSVPELGLRGRGVLFGIIDTGIDYTNNLFKYADGTTKITSIWDQTIQGQNPPTGIKFGTEYTRDQINIALQNVDPVSIVPSVDESGHGTFLAGIAAGNLDQQNNFSGVVPDAELVIVKLKPAKQNLRTIYAVSENAICFQENDIMLGIRYLLDIAEQYDRPLSICVGLGTSQGAHDDQGALNRYLNSITQRDGIVVTVAAGNEGNSRHHYEGVLPIGVDNDSVELNIGAEEPGFSLEIWADAPNTFSLDILSPGGEYVPIIYPRLGERRDVEFIFEETEIQIFFQILGSRSGAQLVLMRFQKPSEGIWKINVNKSNRDLELRFNIWLPISNFIGESTFFIRSSPYVTLTSPGAATLLIACTAYDITNNTLYPEASRGFNRVGGISPDLAAPGVNILGPLPGGGYTTKSGTSISAAHTAGLAAILLEWGKVRGNVVYMDGTDVKNLFLRGAKRDTNLTYPNREWGYGIVDVFGAFQSLRGIT